MLKTELTGYESVAETQEESRVSPHGGSKEFPWKKRRIPLFPRYSFASSNVTRPSKSAARTRVALNGTTVFTTPTPILCSHLTAPVFASSANTKPFFVP